MPCIAPISTPRALLPTALRSLAVKRGDRIAQLILERIAVADVEEVTELDATDRGAGGFGSTGVSGGAGAAAGGAGGGDAKRARTEP